MTPTLRGALFLAGCICIVAYMALAGEARDDFLRTMRENEAP
jgi:hypothetical protein